MNIFWLNTKSSKGNEIRGTNYSILMLPNSSDSQNLEIEKDSWIIVSKYNFFQIH